MKFSTRWESNSRLRRDNHSPPYIAQASHSLSLAIYRLLPKPIPRNEIWVKLD